MKFTWADSPEQVIEAAEFFMDNVDSSYISHGEIQDGRALDQYTWNEDVHKVLLREFTMSLSKSNDYNLGLATKDGKLVCIVFVQIVRTRKTRFAVLEDIVTAKELRGQGFGTALYSWVEEQMKLRGMHQIFLESSVANPKAHEFLEHRGFKVCSLTMMKGLT